MKKLLLWGGTSLIITALLDPLLKSGMNQPVPWLREGVMLAGGIGCIYILVKYRNNL